MSDKEEQRLEPLMQKLEALSRELEQGELPFEEALERYKEGLALLHRCRQFLNTASEQIKEVHAQFLSSEPES